MFVPAAEGHVVTPFVVVAVSAVVVVVVVVGVVVGVIEKSMF